METDTQWRVFKNEEYLSDHIVMDLISIIVSFVSSGD